MRAAPTAEHVQMWSLLALMCFFGAAFGVRLEMFESDGVTATVVSSKVNAESGRNVSLFCRLADESNRYFDTPVVWGRKGKGFRFNEEIILSPNLSFTPIRIVNQGIYFCANLRHALHKTVYVAVRAPEHPNRRLKRETKPDLSRLLKRTLVIYRDGSNDGYEAFMDWFKAYARVVAPVVLVTLIVSACLYCLMKALRMVLINGRKSRVRSCKQHCSCDAYCKPKKSVAGGDLNNPNCNKREAPGPSEATANVNDDTFIFLPCLFE